MGKQPSNYPLKYQHVANSAACNRLYCNRWPNRNTSNIGFWYIYHNIRIYKNVLILSSMIVVTIFVRVNIIEWRYVFIIIGFCGNDALLRIHSAYIVAQLPESREALVKAIVISSESDNTLCIRCFSYTT